MKSKKIAIISASFYPNMSPRSYRATELAKEFALQGHKVVVYTSREEAVHNDFENRHTGVIIKQLGTFNRTIFKLSGNSLLIFVKRIINRLGLLFFEYPDIRFYFLTRNAIRELKDLDLLVSIAVPYPIHWGVASLWNKNQRIAKVWIADCGDPFMHATHDTFKKMFYFHYFENNILRRANFITVPFEEMKNLFNQRYRNKFKVIPQGFKFKNIKLASYKRGDSHKFAFAGTIIPGSRDPFTLIDYLISIGKDFIFVIYNEQPHLFKNYSHLFGSKIIVKQYLPREQLIQELSSMDFLVNINTNSINGVINAIPTKLIDYRLSGRPILSYEHSQLPITIINEFLSGNFENCFVDNSFERYNIEHVANQFLNLL